MNKNFWQKLEKPILALAPMAGFTDSAFRQICKEFGADVVYSEMASAAALVYSPAKTLEMLKFNKKERPYIVQLFGSKPDHFARAVGLINKKIKPDGIDINFGCPVKKAQKQGAGAVLMNNWKLAREIIKAASAHTDLPVSIKTRSQAGQTDILFFLDKLNDLDIKAVMIHGRSLNQGFAGPVDFEIIKKARAYFGGIILANGGVRSAEDGRALLEKTGADGLGIARGSLGRPWIFKEIKSEKTAKRDRKMIFKIILKQARLAEKLKGEEEIIELRKHLSWYAQGWPGAKELRGRLVKVKSLADIRNVLKI